MRKSKQELTKTQPKMKLFHQPAALVGLALSLASIPASHAQALLTSFETDEDLFPETATNTPITRSSSFATEGSSSMAMGVASEAWNWSTKTWGGEEGAANYANWKANKRLLIDMTRVTTAGANLEMIISINGPQGWQQRQLINWQWQNGPLTVARTLEWDYSELTAAAPPAGGSGDYFQLNIVARSSGTGQTIYLDNIRFAPAAPPPPPADIYAFNSATQGFGPTSGAVAVAWSSNFGGSLMLPGGSPGWKAHATKGFPSGGTFTARLAECATRGGSFRYDLIAPAGTLGGFFVQTVLQHSSGTWNSFDQNLAVDSVVSLPGDMELVRVVIPTSVYPNLVATGTYTMLLNWDSATTNTIYLDNVLVIPNGSDSAMLTFDEGEQGFVADGESSNVSWTGTTLAVDGPSGWDWSTKANFTAADPDPQVADVFSKLALAATKGGALRYKVIAPYVIEPNPSFGGLALNAGLSGTPWQQQSALWVPKASFTMGADPDADPPIPPDQTPTGFTRFANVPLYPATATANNGLKLEGDASAYELWVGTNADNVTGVGFDMDDFQVLVNRDPEILHTPPVPNNSSDAMVGRVLSNGEGFTTYSAEGLPPGVSIDPLTGLVTGAPTSNGSYSVVFTVTSGTLTSSAPAVAWVVNGVIDSDPVVPVITGFTYDGNSAVITWSGTGTTPVNVLRSQTLELGSWTEISIGDTDGSHTDATPPAGKAFYRVELP